MRAATPRSAWDAQPESSERPLRRRAAKMARPARVRIRRRKPWVRLRRRRLGWKVRLLTGELQNRSRMYGLRQRRQGPRAGGRQRSLQDSDLPTVRGGITRVKPNRASSRRAVADPPIGADALPWVEEVASVPERPSFRWLPVRPSRDDPISTITPHFHRSLAPGRCSTCLDVLPPRARAGAHSCPCGRAQVWITVWKGYGEQTPRTARHAEHGWERDPWPPSPASSQRLAGARPDTSRSI